MLLCALVTLLSCGSETNIDIPHLVLNKTSLTLREGEEETLHVSMASHFETANIIWASSSPEVATVNEEGKIKAVKSGEASILVAMENASATCLVTVQPRKPQKIVYVAGYEKIGDFKYATLWRNGDPIRLTNGVSNAEAYSVYVVGDDVYVAGYATYGSNAVAVIWKNGIAIPISYKYSHAHSVYVYNNRFYVAGWEYTRFHTATSWQGMTPTHLADRHSYARSVYVANGNTYIGGVVPSAANAVIWENATAMPLKMPSGTTSSEINSVYVSGNNVYGAGTIVLNNKENFPAFWKDSTPTVLPVISIYNGGESVFVSGNDVYVAGFDTYEPGKYLAMLWKNGEAIRLTDGTSSAYARSVYVVNNQAYVAGYEQVKKKYNAAMLWADGVAVRLTDGGSDAEAYSVFVVSE